MEQQWDQVAVNVDAGVVRVGAADQQEAGGERRPRQPRKRLDDADRIAEGAGYRGHLPALDGPLGHLEVFAFALDHGLVRVAAEGPQPQADVELLSPGQIELALEAGVAVVDRDDGVVPGRHAVKVEMSVLVGHRVDAQLGDGDDDAGQLAPGAALHRHALDADRRAGVAAVGRRPLRRLVTAARGRRGGRRRWCHRPLLQLEVDHRLDDDRPGYTVELGRVEDVLLGGAGGGLVEAVTDRRRDVNLGDLARGADVDAHLDVGFAAGGCGRLRVDRRHGLEQHRRPGHHRRFGRLGRMVLTPGAVGLRPRRRGSGGQEHENDDDAHQPPGL